MTNLGTRLTRMVAVGTLAISSLMAGAPAAQANGVAASYPNGTYANVPVASITGTGWTQCWSSTYGSNLPMSDVLTACTGDYLLLAGGPTGGDTYLVAAAAPRAEVLTVTAQDVTHAANGTYWYYNGASMGFAPISLIHQSSADIIDANWGDYVSPDQNTGDWRLSWHTSGGYGETPTSMDGGWRAGSVTSLNGSSAYTRVVYQADTVNSALGWTGGIRWMPLYRQPQLVVDALNVNVAMGESVPADVRVLGLMGTDKVTDIVLEYEGTDIWGVHYGPSTTPPTLAGTYSIGVKSYVFTAENAAQYFQSKHGAQLVIRWKALPIADPKLVAPATGADAPGTVVYGDNGAMITGTGWSLGVEGAPRASIGGFLITDAGTVFTVTGAGYRPWSPIRIYFMSDPVELASLYTDANGAFTAKVTLPNVTGNHTLQVNGYSATNLVRSSNVAMFVGTTRALSDRFLFAKNSSELSSAAAGKIQMMMNSIPVKPWRIHITLTTSALSLTGANARITQERVDNIANRLASSLRAAGVDVVVESTIWYQPGLAPRWEKQARWVYVDLNW